jgi:hypothetical protein
MEESFHTCEVAASRGNCGKNVRLGLYAMSMQVHVEQEIKAELQPWQVCQRKASAYEPCGERNRLMPRQIVATAPVGASGSTAGKRREEVD